MAWRDHVKYPHAEGQGSRLGVEVLDTLDELISIENYVEGAFDRHGIFLSWMRAGKKEGLLTSTDEMNIRTELIHGCGGL